MNPLTILKDELAFIQKHLPDLESSPDLAPVAVEFKKRLDALRQQIKELQEET